MPLVGGGEKVVNHLTANTLLKPTQGENHKTTLARENRKITIANLRTTYRAFSRDVIKILNTKLLILQSCSFSTFCASRVLHFGDEAF